MTEKIINTLKLKLVATELVKMGITDRAKVVAIADRTTVDDSGRIIGLKADGNRGVGSAENHELSIADVAHDMGVAVSPAQHPGQEKGQSLDRNPFVKGPHWNLTEQVLMMKADPERAEYFQHLASIGRA